MIDLESASVSLALPAALKSSTDTKALCAAADWLLTQIHDKIGAVTSAVNLDVASDAALDLLATEWRALNYDVNATKERKRALLRATLPYWISSGTVRATADIVEAVFPGSTLQEWFAYGGDPGYFSVTTTDPSVTDDTVAAFRASVESVKRLSAWLDTVTLALNAEPQTVYIGAVLHDTTEHILTVEGVS